MSEKTKIYNTCDTIDTTIIYNTCDICNLILKDKLYSDCVISPRAQDVYRLVEEFRYKDVIVPVGYKTNGADIPRILWSIFPPNRSTYLPAVIVHDYLCSLKQWKKANLYFNEILKILEVGFMTRISFRVGTFLYFKLLGRV